MPEISEPHATSHESGGEDEVEFLKLTDRKHKTKHQDGGDDEISVAGLSGTLADPQTPSAHKTGHQNGGADEISLSGLGGQEVTVPYNGKIADITHPDTNKHTLDMKTALGETRTVVKAHLWAQRISGSSVLYTYPNEGSIGVDLTGARNHEIVFLAGSSRLYYDLGAANDDFDLYCLGYVVVEA